MILVIHKDTHGWLCQDGCWREFTHFGTYPSSIKQYKTLGRAFNAARHISGLVVQIPDSMEVDIAGVVYEAIPIPDCPGFVEAKQHKITEFVVPFPWICNTDRPSSKPTNPIGTI